MIRFLHTADLHLDWSFPGLASPLRALRRRELITLLDELVRLAIERKVQAMIISGGVFEGSPPPMEAFLAVNEGFTRLAAADILVFLAFSAEETARHIPELLPPADNVKLLGGDTPTVHNDLPGLTVYGFPALPADSQPLREFRCPSRDGLHLGVIHGCYRGLPAEGTAIFSPLAAEEIARSGLDYLALGGCHESYVCLHGGTKAAYPGSPARLAYGQENARGAWLVGLTEGQPELERIVLPSRRFLALDYDMSQTSLVEIRADLAQKADPEACVDVSLSGVSGGKLGFVAEDLQKNASGLFFSLNAEDRMLLKPPGDGNTLGDRFQRRLAERLNLPDLEAHERMILTDAIRAGLAALEGGQA